jgi:hypothetical protein
MIATFGTFLATAGPVFRPRATAFKAGSPSPKAA